MESIPATAIAVVDERLGPEMTVVRDRYDVVLAGHWPTLTTEMVLVAADATIYDVLNVAPSLDRRKTLVEAQNVWPGGAP